MESRVPRRAFSTNRERLTMELKGLVDAVLGDAGVAKANVCVRQVGAIRDIERIRLHEGAQEGQHRVRFLNGLRRPAHGCQYRDLA